MNTDINRKQRGKFLEHAQCQRRRIRHKEHNHALYVFRHFGLRGRFELGGHIVAPAVFLQQGATGLFQLRETGPALFFRSGLRGKGCQVIILLAQFRAQADQMLGRGGAGRRILSKAGAAEAFQFPGIKSIECFPPESLGHHIRSHGKGGFIRRKKPRWGFHNTCQNSRAAPGGEQSEAFAQAAARIARGQNHKRITQINRTGFPVAKQKIRRQIERRPFAAAKMKLHGHMPLRIVILSKKLIFS